MLTSEIVIDRPPRVVWNFFLEPDNWSMWSRLSLSTAHWEVGGSLHFEKNMSSKVEKFTPGSTVTFGDSWSEETWSFLPDASGGTLVRVEEAPRGMAYTDKGVAALAKTAKTLEKFKAAIEAPEEDDEEEYEDGDDVAEVEEATYVPKLEPYAVDEADDNFGEGPNPRLRRIQF